MSTSAPAQEGMEAQGDQDPCQKSQNRDNTEFARPASKTFWLNTPS